MLRFALPALLLSLLWVEPADAEIYRWTDEQGRVHFTQSLDRVPAAQRAEADARAKRGTSRSLNRAGGSSDPAAPAPTLRRAQRRPGGTLQIPFSRDGTLMRVDAMVNDTLRVPFLVDTGASGISLPSAYAERLGLAVGPDTERVQVHTANGIASRALVTLQSVEVGGARVELLEATVSPSMSIGLLGGSFFNNFVYSVDAAAGVISLAPNDNIRGGHGADAWRRRFRELRDPLERLDAHVRDNPKLRDGERAELARHRGSLVERLQALEREADQLDVPQIWRN
jgi:clan AA aspartic protease (TIGR02281 family)